ncbi:MAG TPA: sulfite exporter TauE/SafE family protein, partial [Candidatus Limnocylindria bacterium]|nr:sulfite exporter TauE/SafE family protein [Candidatus Limnocylindria bacterium]
MVDLATSAAGFGVGVIVGLTGIGGGALMTPLLVLVFGVAPHTAVGTDLVFACVTKVFGVVAHGRRGTVDWLVVRRLATGSLPAAAITMLWLASAEGSQVRAGVIMRVLGLALLLTAAGLLARRHLHQIGKRLRAKTPAHFKRMQPALTVVAGFVVGVLVALTSVGAGALATVALVYLYPYRLSAAKLVGTDLAHAIPLTLVAGAGHLALGNIEFGLLAGLLLGSVPGILVGSMFSARA